MISPDGILYVTSTDSHSLYTIDTSNGSATLVGALTGDGVTANGGDLAFDIDGDLYLLSQAGLYSLDLTIPGTVTASLIGNPTPSAYTGMAFRYNGLGDLLASNLNDSFVELSATDASTLQTYGMYLASDPNVKYKLHNIGGDMTTGPLVFCSKTIGYWKNHSWNDATVTINGVEYDEDDGRGFATEPNDKPKGGLLWQAKGKTYSMLYAQLIAAKLNTYNSSNIALLNEAEEFLNGKIFGDDVIKSEKAAYSALVQAVTAFNEDNHCDVDNEEIPEDDEGTGNGEGGDGGESGEGEGSGSGGGEGGSGEY